MKVKKSFKIIFTILAILLVTLVVLLVTQKEEPKGVDTPLGSYEIEFTEKSVNTENFDEVLNDLPIPSIDMRAKIQDFSIKFLKSVYPIREYTEKEIVEYYDSNKIALYEYLYKTDLESFIELANKLKEIDETALVYTKSTFYPKTLKLKNGDYTVDLQLEYNNKYQLKFKVHVEPEKNNKITFELVK